ncbi:MAG: hypothetical protein HOB40_09945 [Candidatus Marinimicrobia bacterium]|jgi:FtsZ-interacting cell division protein ZipA|nr:hypothetical protein [Candidatus Neomarinimicrobiota bacterium]MBT3502408.1 hypothetical protein [Candidatus Neomarinimicrobiota bacterium]MBT3838794.1 hypothetical protein [Candidatus Neomarinimicrobiota bacterium]MBT3999632.1 hypothetical protein [Candidatus Neomarinimicrobiota bacterium]MBT4578803.1 hypothetical protein [Candidatus Neomarinimicrobiota bacterium]
MNILLIIIVIVSVLLYALKDKRDKKRGKLDSALAKDIAQKKKDSNADIVSYGHVMERKTQLNELIDTNLGDHPKQSEQLKDIIEDWAHLKIESFENRRSWVRSPKKK